MSTELWPSTIVGLLVAVVGGVILVLAHWRARVSSRLTSSKPVDLDAPGTDTGRGVRRSGRRSVIIAGWCVLISAVPAVVPVALPAAVWVGGTILGGTVAGAFLMHGAIALGQASVIDAALRNLHPGTPDDEGVSQ